MTHYDASTNERVTFSQNGEATWVDLRRAFTQMLSDSLSGLRISGSAVCGGSQSNLNVDEELCLRWYQMASMSPFFKVYSTITPDKFSLKTAKFMITALRRLKKRLLKRSLSSIPTCKLFQTLLFDWIYEYSAAINR